MSEPRGCRIMSKLSTPAGFKEVTKAEFFAVIGPQDVNPTVQNPAFTTWETRSREVVGWSYPGWKNSGNPNTPKMWALKVKP